MNNTYKADDKIQCEFIRMPKAVFDYDISLEARVLYSLLLDRITLSQQNKLVNGEGEVYILYTRDEAAKRLGVSLPRAVAVFKELTSHALIREVRQGRGKANLIYVNKISKTLNSTECNSGVKETETLELNDVKPINTYNKNTESKETYCLITMPTDEMAIETIKNNCELEIYESDMCELFERAIERLYYCDSFKVGGVTLPQHQIRKYLFSLDADAIINVFDSLRAKDRTIKKPLTYIMSAIINSACESKSESAFSCFLL